MERLVHTADDHRIVLLALQLGSSLVFFARNDDLERDNRVCSRDRALPTRVSDRANANLWQTFASVVREVVMFVLHVSLTFCGPGSCVKLTNPA